MAKGDVEDFHSRLRALLPTGWFADPGPVLTGALSACAQSLSWCYALYLFARKQSRIASSCGGWLDMAAFDFFGDNLRRPTGVSDDSFRHQLQRNLFRERGTRQAVISIVEEITGTKPDICEPGLPSDTGAYHRPGSGYGMAGRYGSLVLTYQAFVTVRRPVSTGVPPIAGYRVSTTGYGQPSQGAYVSQAIISGNVPDAQIYAAIAALKMEGTLVWVNIH